MATPSLPVPAGHPIAGRYRLLALASAALAVGMAASTVVGPVVLGWLDYRTSSTTLNQLKGSGLAALLFASPLGALAAVACRRGHPAGPMLASGVGAFALYTYPQVIVGQEYLRLPGNVERFFPLLLAVFLLAGATVLLA